jgi:hypothetical protein
LHKKYAGKNLKSGMRCPSGKAGNVHFTGQKGFAVARLPPYPAGPGVDGPRPWQGRNLLAVSRKKYLSGASKPRKCLKNRLITCLAFAK